MRAFRGFAIPALAGLLFFGTPSALQAQPGQGPFDENEPFVEGVVEEVGMNGILVNGRYYYLDDVIIEDGPKGLISKEELKAGSTVVLYLKQGKLITVTVKAVPED
jgi:hypothetical protein